MAAGQDGSTATSSTQVRYYDVTLDNGVWNGGLAPLPSAIGEPPQSQSIIKFNHRAFGIFAHWSELHGHSVSQMLAFDPLTKAFAFQTLSGNKKKERVSLLLFNH